MIKITYHGHSCFTLEAKGFTAVVDPYDEKTGYGALSLKANAVYCSHEHGDHNYTAAVEITDGPENPFKVSEFVVPHDHEEGHKRGLNKIRIFEADGVKIAHFGDTGCMPDQSILENLKGLDAAMIPVGGFFTIDAAEAKALCDAIEPKLIVPMHFRKGGNGLQIIDEVTAFTDLYDAAQICSAHSVEIDGSSKGVFVPSI